METRSKIKLLVIRPDAIGDVVLMIPLLNSIKATFPDAEIFTLQQSYTQPLLRNHPSVKEVIIDWKKAGKLRSPLDFFRYARFLRSYQFDAAIFSYLDTFYACLIFMARIPLRIGDKNKMIPRLFLNKVVPQTFRNLLTHEVEHNLTLLKGLRPKPALLSRMDLYHEPRAIEKACRILRDNGWNGEKLIGIHASTGGGNRAWLPKKYAEFIEDITQKTPYRVVLTGQGRKDEALVNDILRAAYLPLSILNLIGKTDIQTLMGVVSQCDAFVGTDTGPTHIAAALKIPVLCISPTKFVKSLRWGPWDTLNKIIGNPKDCPYVCNPYRCQRPNCLEAISARDAFDGLEALLKEKQQDMTPNITTLRKEWFRASINLMIMINSMDTKKDAQKIVQVIHALTQKGMAVTLIARKPRSIDLFSQITPLLPIPIHILSPFQISKMIRFIATHDINLIHVWDTQKSERPRKKTPLLWALIRQIAALFIYAPPIILTDIEKDELENKDPLTAYLKAYKHYYDAH